LTDFILFANSEVIKKESYNLRHDVQSYQCNPMAKFKLQYFKSLE